MRGLHGVLCLLYALAAAVQWNDPEPVRWIAIYGGAALVAGAAATGRPARWPAIGIAGIALVWAAILAPEALDGLRTSPGEVFGAMSMHAHHVEEAREALGLVLVTLGPLERIDDDLWSIESPVPGLPGASFPRRMTIVRRADGSLLFHNAIPVDDGTLAQVRALGSPAVVVVPSPVHALDARAFREKLGVRAVAPRASLDALSAKTQIDGALEDLPVDPRCRFLPLAGLNNAEHVLLVTSPDGARVSLTENSRQTAAASTEPSNRSKPLRRCSSRPRRRGSSRAPRGGPSARPHPAPPEPRGRSGAGR